LLIMKRARRRGEAGGLDNPAAIGFLHHSRSYRP
jgi:hypothetical protein